MLISGEPGRTIEIDRIIDNLPSAILVLNRETRILLANGMAAFLAGKPRHECVGLRGGEALNCVHAHDVEEGCGYGPECAHCLVRGRVEETFRARANCSLTEVVLELETLGLRAIRLTTTYLAEDDIVILAIEDITESKKSERERLDKNRLLAAVETAGAVCHEMNQPLQVILGYIETLIMESKSEGFTRECLGTMKDQTLRLRDITLRLQNLRTFKVKRYLENTDILDLGN